MSVADTKSNIGLVYEKTGKKSEAKTLFTEAAKIRRNKFGPDHPLTKTVLSWYCLSVLPSMLRGDAKRSGAGTERGRSGDGDEAETKR